MALALLVLDDDEPVPIVNPGDPTPGTHIGALRIVADQPMHVDVWQPLRVGGRPAWFPLYVARPGQRIIAVRGTPTT